ncbi:MAG: hypothetical protein ACRDZ7_05870 [Acidimicrobiia bacterium]
MTGAGVARYAGGWVLSGAAYAMFAAVLTTAMMRDSTPFEPGQILEVVVWSAILGAPWTISTQVLWRAWWRRTGGRVHELDGPARLLALATVLLPDDRREWGDAMSAELAHLGDAGARWRFAAGGLRAALAPQGLSAAMAVAAALSVVAVAVAWLTAGAVRGAGVFALTFAGLVAALAIALAPRWRRERLAASGLVIAGTALAGAGACIAAIVFYLGEYPSAAGGLPPVTAVVFATVLAAGSGLALFPPRTLVVRGPQRWFGVGMALVLGAGTMLLSRLALNGATDLQDGLMEQLWLGSVAVFACGSAAAARAGRSLRAGLQACVWAFVLGLPLAIVAWLVEDPRWQRQIGGSLLDADTIPLGSNLGDALWWTLVLLVLFAVPFGVIGACAGSARARRQARAVAG